MIFVQLESVKVFIWEEIVDQLCHFRYIVTLLVFKNLKYQFFFVAFYQLSKRDLLMHLTFVQSREWSFNILLNYMLTETSE